MRCEIKFVVLIAVMLATSTVAALTPVQPPPERHDLDITAVDTAKLLAAASDWSAPAEVGESVEWSDRRWTVVGVDERSLALVDSEQARAAAPAGECRVIGLAVRDGDGEIHYRKHALREIGS
jgi:hypothetical protein